MKSIFIKLRNIQEEKKLSNLQKKAKPFFDFINFLKVSGIKFYYEIDLGEGNGGIMKYEIDPNMDQINQWVVKYFEAVKFINSDKVNK